MTTIKLGAILIVLLILILSTNTRADPPLSELSLTSAQAGDHLGYSVSVSSNLAIIGSPYATRNSLTNCGSVSIWQYDSQLSIWDNLIILDAYDNSPNDQFGFSVSLSSGYALIGSPYHSNIAQTGVAYLYQQQSGNASQWNNITQFVAKIPQASAHFGNSVAFSSPYVVIGAIFNNGYFTNDGTAYIFSKDKGGINNWGFVKQLNASDPHLSDKFGSSVAISGIFVLVGAYYGDSTPSNVDTGTAYLFSKDFGGQDNWGMRRRFTSPSLTATGYFGCSVSISGDYILIGAYGVQNTTGMAHLYYRNNGGTDQWGLSSNISQLNGQANDWFGYSVALQGSNIIISAIGVNANRGMSYVTKFNPDGSVITPPLFIVNDVNVTAINDFFGWSVAIDNNLVLFGARHKNNTGKAYSMELPISPIAPSHSNLYKTLIIVCIICAVVGISISVGVIFYRYNKSKSKSSRKNGKGKGEDDLLEFSSREDMKFADIHGPGQKRKRPPSIQSGSSIATTLTQNSNATVDSTKSDIINFIV